MEEKNPMQLFKKAFQSIFDISQDTDTLATIEDIKAGIQIKGQTAWVLVFSILIASTGLNTSSTAVVIGAMLISPLMGPILGIGLSLGINNIDMLKKAIFNFGIMIFLSLLTSFLFFSIPMFQEETAELVNRTYPDVRDVIIAFSGGFALVIAFSRRNKSITTIAGVAIATALMPPLCTAGYGLATGKWNFFGGAMFLFTINTIFIASATFIVVRFLKFPYETYANSKRRKQLSRIIAFVAFAILIPSVYMFYQLYQKSNFNQNVDAIIKNIRTEKGIIILDLKKDFSKKSVSFSALGKSFNAKDILDLQNKMKNYGFENVDFQVIQDVSNLESIHKIEEMKNSYLSTQQLLLQKENELLQKEREIVNLKANLAIRNNQIDILALENEIQALQPNVAKIIYSQTIFNDFVKKDTLETFTLFWNKKANKETENMESEGLKKWLQLKLNKENIVVKNGN